MQDYRTLKAKERTQIIKQLYTRIDHLYADEKIKPEKLQEYTQGLVAALRKTSVIDHFSQCLGLYMPKYNELKHFNASKIVNSYHAALLE